MEPQRGEEPLLWGKKRTSNDAGAAACLCPGTAAPAASSARLVLEHEVLYRADLQLQGAGTGGDRRRERKTKNRESAARSRARRHSYVNEVKEVELLRAENEQLRRLCEELKEAAEAEVPVPVKRTPQLQRTSSAPL